MQYETPLFFLILKNIHGTGLKTNDSWKVNMLWDASSPNSRKKWNLYCHLSGDEPESWEGHSFFPSCRWSAYQMGPEPVAINGLNWCPINCQKYMDFTVFSSKNQVVELFHFYWTKWVTFGPILETWICLLDACKKGSKHIFPNGGFLMVMNTMVETSKKTSKKSP